MTTGFYPNLPAAEYFAEERISKTILMAHRKSAAHALHAMTARQETTAAMRTGSLVHTLTLEPEQFASRYAVGPDAARNTREWKDWASQQADGVELIKPGEYADAEAMTAWKQTMPVVASLLTGPGPVEASVLWTETDAMTGVELALRARPDKVRLDKGILIDLKTTADISDRAIERTIHTYGYHLQLALYMRGLRAVGHGCDHAILIFVETAAPHTARALLLGQSWMEAAELELRVLMTRHAECVASGRWDGFPDAIMDSEAPAWLTVAGGAK